MPLYELILITRCSKPSGTANLMRMISKEIFKSGGNVRGVQVLGDRVLTKKIIASDEGRHIVGRYVQILYDSHPKVEKNLRQIAFESFETLRVHNFRVKDFISQAVHFKKPLEEEAPFIKNKEIDSKRYHQALKVLKEEKQKAQM